MKRLGLAAALILLAGAAPGQESEHVVRSGETLYSIAARAGVAVETVAEANGLRPPYTLRRGQRLTIPRERRYRVRAGDSAFTIAWNLGVPWREIAAANGLPANARPRPGQELIVPTPGRMAATPLSRPSRPDARPRPEPRLTWPVEGQIRRGFLANARAGGNHNGIDIVADEGDSVRAVAPGRVLFAGQEPQQFGNLVVVDHGNGWHSAYAFLSRVTVREGQRIKARDRIGRVGHSGQATRDELHFELRRDNRPVDPLPLLPRQ
jgi:murein DD-endopeptidase MepM/ murein hydrolase activator NlpD